MQNGQQQANAPAWALFGLLAQPLPGIANKSASALHQVEGKKKKKRMTFLRALVSGGKKNKFKFLLQIRQSRD